MKKRRLGASLKRMIPRAQHDHKLIPTRRPRLTERQREILQKLREGKSCRLIGEELFISENTVKCHIKKIYELARFRSAE